MQKIYKDKNNIQLKSGDIINLHQTVNGENIFVMLDLKELDLRYGFEISYSYQYDVDGLLSQQEFGISSEWEIIGNVNAFISTYRKF